MRINGSPQQQAALFAALATAQGQYEPIYKNKTVRVGLKSGGSYTFNYADLDGVLSATRAALSNNGLALFQTLGEATEKELGKASITLGTLTTVLAHADGAYIEDVQTFSLAGTNQEMGGEITYKRRYAAGSILGVAPEEDDDGGHAPNMTEKTASDRPTPARAPKATTAPPADFAACTSIGELTAAFNALPADTRRPGTPAFEAFKARRAELTPRKDDDVPF